MNPEQIDQAVLDFCKSLSPSELTQLPFRKIPFTFPEKSWILQQAQLYALAKSKLSSWWERGDLIFPDRTAIEQSTHPILARWKSQFLGKFPWIWDVCSGLGVDAFTLGDPSQPLILTEPDLIRAACLEWNGKKWGYQNLQVLPKFWSPDDFPKVSGPGLILADPDRRAADGKRIGSWKDSSPDLEAVFELARNRKTRLLVKFSPLDDPDEILSSFPGSSVFFLLSFHNELKEMGAFWDFSLPEFSSSPQILGVECRQDGRWSSHLIKPGAEKDSHWTSAAPGQFLLDPWVVFRRKTFALDLSNFPSVQPLHPETRLYLAPELPTAFPGRIFEIESVHSQLKEAARQFPDGNGHVVVRHFPTQPEEIRKKFRWTERGERYLFCLGIPGLGNQFLVARRCPEAFSPDFWKILP